MKIGEFAKKHSVTVDTVRHYINEGLLTPLRENTQFSFSEIDDRVMDSIILLKSMNFKLEEMKSYLLFQTMYTNNTFSYLGNFRKKFEDKLEENKQEIKRLQYMNDLIEKQIGTSHDVEFTRGIALSMLSDLICPDCSEELELDATSISHNEIIEGKLVCPKCGRTYYIRYGFMSDQPIDEPEYLGGVAELAEHYLERNDENYVLKMREIFQKVADITKNNSVGAKNILIDGESTEFINSSILRTIPKDARLFARVRENITMKAFLEDLFPKNTVFYVGDIQNVPFKVPMDYMFLQDYDIDTYFKKRYDSYPYLAPNAKIDCFKTYIYGEQEVFPNEKIFLEDMAEMGFQKENIYYTGKILNKKDSCDFSIIEKNGDMEVEYAIYSFKTLG